MTSKAFPVPSFYYFAFLCCCSLYQLLQTTAVSRDETDLLSLLAIKDQIQGLSSWNQSFHFCQWKGVVCGKHHLRVTALILSDQNLAGSLSPHIGNLSFLRSIDLHKNKFQGVVPQDIGRLRRLRYVNLQDNAFTGEIPVNLTQCTDLETIVFALNNLTGRIPAEIGFLPKLQALFLGGNTLTGGIPVSLGNLSSLEVFNLANNHLEGNIPHTLGKLSSLKVFNVELNRLSGEFPSLIFNISSITNFSIVANQLTGSLPPDLGIKLPHLLFFAASGNQLSGYFPVSLGNASRIRLFDIATNSLTGQVPGIFGSLQNIKWLAFSDNDLGRGEDGDLSFITSLTNLSSLETLSVSHNNFGGVLPISMSNISAKLVTLYLGHNPIAGTIPEGIGNLVNLIILGLEATHIHGNIPSSIGNIQQLQALSLFGSEFTGHIPSSLANNTQLFLLDLSANRLEGSIPSGLGDFRHLQQLDLSQNNLNGTIPKEIFGISSLSYLLNFSQNSFTGSLPQNVGSLKNLRALDVSTNMLSGEVPSALGDCSSMEALYLKNNLFKGEIPQSLKSLKGIRFIDLSNNSFSGQVPKYLEDLPYLEGLNLSFNKLEGEVPKTGIFKNESAISVAGNPKLCGGIDELQLLTCRVDSSRKKGSSNALKVSISVLVALTLLVAVTFLILYLIKKPTDKDSSSGSLKPRHLKVSFGKLFKATGGFSPDNFLGSGSFGRVYKGKLDHDEMIIAVKVFNLQQRGASKTFKTECESLRIIRHRNLVKIVTSCSSTDFEGNDFKALVFEYMPNGSLEEWLHPVDTGQEGLSRNLNLLQRLNIATDVASALSYLHHQSHIAIVHRDLKPSNVLLDNNLVAHVGDFGLARLLPESRDSLYENRSSSMAIKGSIGYVAPEYGIGGDASTQGDVFSFGILLLEMFTGRRPTDEMFVDGLDIHNFASMALPGRILEIVDPILTSTDEVMLECIALIVSIGVACSAQSPGERMNIEEVVNKLERIRDAYFSHSEERARIA